MGKETAVAVSLDDAHYRAVIGYYSLDISERNVVEEGLLSGELTPLMLHGKLNQESKLQNHDAVQKLLLFMCKKGINGKLFVESTVKHEDAIEAATCLLRYRLLKRRSWAKRRVVNVSYEADARWKTSINLDISMDYLREYHQGIYTEAESQDIFYAIPILDVDKNDQFVFYDARDSSGKTIQLIPRDVSAKYIKEILIGAISEEFWDDGNTVMLREDNEDRHEHNLFTQLLEQWFREPNVPSFFKSIEEQIYALAPLSDMDDDSIGRLRNYEFPFENDIENQGYVNEALNDWDINTLLDNLSAFDHWICEADCENESNEELKANTFMDLFRHELCGEYSDESKLSTPQKKALYRLINAFGKQPIFVFLIATYSLRWLAYLRVPVTDTDSETVCFSYALTRNVLKKEAGSEFSVLAGCFGTGLFGKGFKRGFGKLSRIASGETIQLPLPMLCQAESEHFTFIAPEGTFFLIIQT